MADKQQKPVDWAKVLKDTKNYADDMAIPLPNGETMLLGDIRAYNNATENSVQKQLQEVAYREEQTKRAETQVAQNYMTLQQQQKDFEQQKSLWEQQFKQPQKPMKQDAFEDVLESDPVYQRLSKSQKEMLEKFDAYQKSMDEKLAQINNTFNTMGSTYLGDSYHRTTADIKARNDPWMPKDMTVESLYKYANDNRIAKPNGILDLDRAYNQMTNQAKLDYETKQAYDKGRTEALKERDAAAMMPPPRGQFDIPGLDNSRLDKIMGGQARPKNLDEAFAAAARDPSIFNIGQGDQY